MYSYQANDRGKMTCSVTSQNCGDREMCSLQIEHPCVLISRLSKINGAVQDTLFRALDKYMMQHASQHNCSMLY